MSLDPYALKIYVDGSALRNPGGPGGIAGVLEYPDAWNRHFEELFAIGYLNTTNNRMELLACIQALEYVRAESSALRVQRVLIVTDSQYLHDYHSYAEIWKSNGWKTSGDREVENRDLWDMFLSVRRKQKLRVEIVWKKGKKSQILKAVDYAAKNAAKQPWEIDRGYRPGKVGNSKLGGKRGSTLFPARGQEEIIHVYRKGLTGRDGNHVRFDLYSELEQRFVSKHLAYTSAELSLTLHRHHLYRVKFNDDPMKPIIERVIEEVSPAHV